MVRHCTTDTNIASSSLAYVKVIKKKDVGNLKQYAEIEIRLIKPDCYFYLFE